MSSKSSRSTDQVPGSYHKAVSAAFSEVVTRRRFCDLVGIHKTTLRRWERLGIVVPRSTPIQGINTWVFSDEDVEVGREITRLIRESPGEASLQEAATIARAAIAS